MSKKSSMVEWIEQRPTWQKWALAGAATFAVVATGGLAVVAIAKGGVIVAAGEVLVVAGPAALEIARRG